MATERGREADATKMAGRFLKLYLVRHAESENNVHESL